MKGVWYEACASEGHCSLYFGRDLESPCKSFQVFQIDEGKIGDTDLSGILAINVVDLYSAKAGELMLKGGEGGVYIQKDSNEEQRQLLDTYFSNNISGGSLLRKNLGTKYVDINMEQENGTYHISMPHGEMKISLTVGIDGKNPQRIENSPFGVFFTDLKISNTHFWKYNDFGRNWDFKNRSGMIANFNLSGKAKF